MIRWRLVTIQQKGTESGPDGPVETWTDVETRRARVAPLSAQARAQYQALQSEVTHQVTFRGPVTLSLADHRIAIGGQILYPAAPPENPGGLGRYTTVAVREDRGA